MLKSVKDLSNWEITKIIENNLFEQIRFYSSSPKVKLIDNRKIIKFLTRIPLPFFNCVVFYNYNYNGVEKEIKNFTRYGISKNTSLLWLTGPSSEPKNIGALLEENSFKYDDHMMSMAMDTSDLNRELKNIPGIEIETVDSKEKLERWVHSCLRGFDENGKNYEKIYEFEEALGYARELPWIRFTGIFEGEAIATSAVFIGTEVAGLDNVTTVPKWRKKGIGALMVTNTLQFTQSLGYHVSVLQASDMGINLYKHLGFKQYYEFKEYVWKNNNQDK